MITLIKSRIAVFYGKNLRDPWINQLIFIGLNMYKKLNLKNPYLYHSVVLIVSAGILIFYSFHHFLLNKNMLIGFSCLITSIFVLTDFIYIQIKKKLLFNLFLCIFSFTIMCIVLNFALYNSSILMWILISPLIVFYTQKIKFSVVFLILFPFMSIFINLVYCSIYREEYLPTIIVQLLLFLLISLMTLLYAISLNKQNKIINYQLNYHSNTDLPSRNKLYVDLNTESDKTVALISIDQFNALTNLYGRDFGDLVILELSERLKKFFFQNKDFNIYKLEHDEFVILNRSSDNKVEIEKTILKVMDCLGKIITLDGINLFISVSVGVFSGNKDFMKNSNLALHHAISNQKNISFYDITMNKDDQFKGNLKVLKELRDGILNKDIKAHYQPIVNLVDGTVSKYESLARLYSGNEIHSPFVFLELSKKAKLYPNITRIMIQNTFEYFKDRNESFSINIDIDDIQNLETITYLCSKIKEFNVGARLVLEILEYKEIKDFELITAFINSVKCMGCKIAIDDFGAGYANFIYVLKLKADFIKIDASIIKNIDKDYNSMVVAKSIVAFSKELGIKTIAEYVERSSVLEVIKKIGVDFAQGYYLGKPKDCVL